MNVRKIVIILLTLLPIASVFGEYSTGLSFINVNAANLIIIFLTFTTALDAINRGRVRFKFVNLAYVSLLTVSLGSIPFGVTRSSQHLRVLVTFAKGLIVVVIMAYWLKKYSQVKYVSYGLVAAGALVFLGSFAQGILGIGEQYLAGNKSASRLYSIGINWGVKRSPGFIKGLGLWGVYIESMVFLGSIGFMKKGRQQNYTLVSSCVLVAVALFSLLLSQSRSSLVSLLVGYTIFATLSIYTYTKNRLKMYAVYAIVFLSISYASSYLIELIYSLDVLTIAERIELLEIGIEEVRRNPLVGVGFGAIKEKLNTDSVVHNSFVVLLLSAGIPTLVAYLYIYLKALISSFGCLHPMDIRAPLAIALISSFASFLVEASFWGGEFLLRLDISWWAFSLVWVGQAYLKGLLIL